MKKIAYKPFVFKENPQGNQNSRQPDARRAAIHTTPILSRLPRLADVPKLQFKIPAFDLEPVAKPVERVELTQCVNCNVKLAHEGDFAQKVGVCRKCIGMHATIDIQLNESADRQSKIARLQKFVTLEVSR